MLEDYLFVSQAVAKKLRVSPLLFDDAVQEGMLALTKAEGRHNPKLGSFRNFAFTVVRYRMIDFLRSQKQRTFELAGARIHETDEHEELQFEDDIHALSKLEKRVVRLHYHDDFSLAAISRMMGIPQYTIQRIHNAALQFLKPAMEGTFA